MLSIITHCFRKLAHIPGPKRTSFVYGNVELIKSRTLQAGDIGSLFLDFTLQYGDVFIVWKLTNPYVITSDLASVKEFSTNLKIFKKPTEGVLELMKIGQTSFAGYHSVLTDEGGPNWERKRRIMDPGFKISRLQAHISKFYLLGEQAANCFESLQQQNGFVAFEEVIAKFTTHAISSAGFNFAEEVLNTLSDGNSLLSSYVESQTAETSPFRKTRFAALLGFDNVHRPAAERQLQTIRELGKQLIVERIESGRLGNAYDVLDLIISANEEDGALSMECCLDDLMAIYAAGNFTTRTTMCFFLAEMIRNVHIQEALVREVDEVWGGREISRHSSDEEIVSAVRDMVYLDAVLKETLRRHPPGLAVRTLQEDIEILNHRVPAGVLVMVSQKVLHHHPKYWDHPNTFDPDRFLGNKEITPFSYCPFLMGPRRCLGKNFAIWEMKIFIAVWLSRMRFEKLSDSDDEIFTEQSLLVKVLDNRMIVRLR